MLTNFPSRSTVGSLQRKRVRGVRHAIDFSSTWVYLRDSLREVALEVRPAGNAVQLLHERTRRSVRFAINVTTCRDNNFGE